MRTKVFFRDHKCFYYVSSLRIVDLVRSFALWQFKLNSLLGQETIFLCDVFVGCFFIKRK